MPDLVIRRATPADAEALAAISRATFVETFGHLYPEEDLNEFLEHAYSVGETQRLLADPRHAAWLVEAGDEAVGHALAGPCELPHPDVTASCGELKRLYLLKAHQRGGVGSRLLELALEWLEANGAGRLWVGVWSENYSAQRLYERRAFKKVGEYEFPVGRVRDREFILSKPVQP